jgi:hypothetical protein
MSLIDARRHDCRGAEKADNGINNKGRIFTDGEYIYGPYDFDLFSNEFYQFRDGNDTDADDTSKRTNDDEAESTTRSELLKNHDELDNTAAEVSFVRDMEAERGCEILRNDNNRPSNNDGVDIEINVTNCSDDDEPDSAIRQHDDDVAFDKNFNYISTEAYDRNLIDLMDEGDNYVSNYFARREHTPPDGDLHIAQPTITTQIYAESFDAQFIQLLNNSQQFNYERNKIVEITDENERLYESTARDECSESCDDEKFSNDERRKLIFVRSDASDDTKNKIRFKEHDETFRQPSSTQLYPMSDKHCDELDNCFSESKIAADDRG